MNQQQLELLLEKVASDLGEHFDAVQILASWNEEGLTKCAKRGTGNWYSRQGMAHEFINSDIAQEAAYQIKNAITPPPESGEEWKKL